MNRLDALFAKSPVLPIDSCSKIVLMSDCHRGVGNWGDNFLRNEHLFLAALSHYEREGFTYIELGDGDELWENKDMRKIVQAHTDAFYILGKLYQKGRLYMLYGNHDNRKKKKSFVKKSCKNYYCETTNQTYSLFPGLNIHESLILRHRSLGFQLFLIHGHQGDLLNDRLIGLTGFLVRYLWRPLELAGIHDPTSAARNYSVKNKTEKRLCDWASLHRQPLAAGHTHRPSLPSPQSCPYFNCGSCVHPRCITALEITNNSIVLVKWCVQTRKDLNLYVGREILKGPVLLEQYKKQYELT